MENEIWKDIEGYEGLYQVSNIGRVKSLDRITMDSVGRSRFRKGEIKSQRKNNKGYYYVNLHNKGNYSSKTVHKLVGVHFVYGYFEGAVLNHLDEDKTNNNDWNLEWTTQYLNSIYGNSLKSRKKPIKQMTNNGVIIKSFDCAEETKILGYNPGKIRLCCNGINKTHRGYIWEYDNNQ